MLTMIFYHAYWKNQTHPGSNRQETSMEQRCSNMPFCIGRRRSLQDFDLDSWLAAHSFAYRDEGPRIFRLP